MKKFLILPAVFFCLSFNTIHKNAEKNFFAPSAGTFLYIPNISSSYPGTIGAGVLTGHLDEVSIDVISENQMVIVGTTTGGTSVGTSIPQINDYVFAKNFDKSSLRLKKMLYGGQSIPNLEFRIYDGVAINPVYKIVYTTAFIAKIVNSIQPCSGANCTGITEEISVSPRGSITWINSIPIPTAQTLTYNFITNTFTSSGL